MSEKDQLDDLHQARTVPDAITYDTDLSGRMFVIRKGENERPADRVQIITNRFKSTTGALKP